MATHARLLSSTWAWLVLVMASTASALSLSSFQPITSTSVPLGCILAYNKQIPSCTMNDFTRGQVCSTACVRALTSIQYTLISACNDANVDPGTVLGQVLLANLVDLLCPGTSPAATGSLLSSSSSSINSPTPSPTTTTNVARTTTSSKTVLTFTVVRPSSTTTSSASNSRATTTTTARAETSSTPEPTAAPDTSIPFQQSETPSSTSAASSSSSRAPAASPEPNTQNSSGGGSPFDAVTSGAGKVTTCWAAAWAVWGVGLLLLR